MEAQRLIVYEYEAVPLDDLWRKTVEHICSGFKDVATHIDPCEERPGLYTITVSAPANSPAGRLLSKWKEQNAGNAG